MNILGIGAPEVLAYICMIEGWTFSEISRIGSCTHAWRYQIAEIDRDRPTSERGERPRPKAEVLARKLRYLMEKVAKPVRQSEAMPTIFTIGHSTRTIDEFLALLQQAAIDLLIDVRSVPRSRTNPQFNADALPAALAEAGIAYRHLPALGGLRHRYAWGAITARGTLVYPAEEVEARAGSEINR